MHGSRSFRSSPRLSPHVDPHVSSRCSQRHSYPTRDHSSHGAEGALASPSFSALSRKINCLLGFFESCASIAPMAQPRSHGKARGRHSTDDSARFVSVMVSVRVPERRHYTHLDYTPGVHASTTAVSLTSDSTFGRHARKNNFKTQSNILLKLKLSIHDSSLRSLMCDD